MDVDPPNEPVLRLLSHVEPIERSLRKRECLAEQEAEDLHSYLQLKLVERGASILAGFKGRSTLETYLSVVVQRLFLDFRVERTGKWRPSAIARRLGPIAVRLEELIERRGGSVSQAIDELRSRHGVPLSVSELESLAAQLPSRPMRSNPVDGELRAAESAPAAPMADPVSVREDERSARRIESLLESALTRLEEEDRAIVRLHFFEGLSIAAVSSLLGVRQKPLYRRVERILVELRRNLEKAGVDRREVDALIGRPEFAIGSPGSGKP